MSGELVIDLRAFRANIAHVQATVSPALLMLVVKDDAYGHGLARLAPVAHEAGVQWFGAFDARTGAGVRAQLGAVPRVFVWTAGTRDEVRRCVADDLDIGVGDDELLEEAADVARELGRRARVHLKIDSGLHRNGVRPEDWPAFCARAAELQAAGLLDVVGIWSHLAEASDHDDDDARAVYRKAVLQAIDAGLRPQWRHLVASAAAFARAGFRDDMVRVAAFCYGIRSAGGPNESELGIRPIASLRATVLRVSSRGVHVGVGALDGLPSTLAGKIAVGTPAGARGVREISAIEMVIDAWADAAPGQVVVVYGPSDEAPSTATDLAEAIGTIGEEIALRISPAVPRRYLDDTAGP